ncbi:hypothetical protein D3C76_1340070 [compost metagenome]
MVADRVDGKAHHLGVALVELRLELGQVAQLGGADRGEVLRVGEQDGPLVADPLVEVEGAFGAFGGEIGGFVTNADSHVRPPFCWLGGCRAHGRGRKQAREPAGPESIGRRSEPARRGVDQWSCGGPRGCYSYPMEVVGRSIVDRALGGSRLVGMHGRESGGLLPMQ